MHCIALRGVVPMDQILAALQGYGLRIFGIRCLSAKRRLVVELQTGRPRYAMWLRSSAAEVGSSLLGPRRKLNSRLRVYDMASASLVAACQRRNWRGSLAGIVFIQQVG